MIAAAALSHRRAAEFASPQEERVVEQAALLQILDQRRARLVHVLRRHRHVLLDVAVMIPRAMIKLNHPHTALGEPPGHEAVRREAAVARLLDAIGVEHVLRLIAEVGQLRHRGLHAERQFVLRNTRGDLGISALLRQQSVHAVHLLDDLPLRALADALGIANVMHRVALGLKQDPLILAGQQAAGPLPRRDRLLPGLALRREHDEARQLLRLRAQSVEQPRAHARTALDDRAGVHERMRRVVVDLLGLHRANHTHLVRHALKMGKEIGDFDPGLSALLKLRERTARLQLRVLQLRQLLPLRERLGERLLVDPLQLRLPVERLEMRRPARHAQVDDTSGAHREMRRVHHAARKPCGGAWPGGIGEQPGIQQASQRRRAQAVGRALQERPPVEAQGKRRRVKVVLHGRINSA